MRPKLIYPQSYLYPPRHQSPVYMVLWGLIITGILFGFLALA